MRHKPFVIHTKLVEVKGASPLLSVMLYPVLLTRWCLSALSRVKLLFLSLVMKEATLKKSCLLQYRSTEGIYSAVLAKQGL